MDKGIAPKIQSAVSILDETMSSTDRGRKVTFMIRVCVPIYFLNAKPNFHAVKNNDILISVYSLNMKLTRVRKFQSKILLPNGAFFYCFIKYFYPKFMSQKIDARSIDA